MITNVLAWLLVIPLGVAGIVIGLGAVCFWLIEYGISSLRKKIGRKSSGTVEL